MRRGMTAMKWFSVPFACVALLGCTSPRGPWQWTCTVGTWIGAGVVAAVTGGVDISSLDQACLTLPEGQSEQAQAGPTETAEGLCFCPYQEPL